MLQVNSVFSLNSDRNGYLPRIPFKKVKRFTLWFLHNVKTKGKGFHCPREVRPEHGVHRGAAQAEQGAK